MSQGELNGTNKEFAKKWSGSVAEHGFTMLPNLLLANQARLGISDEELIVFINLEQYRHHRGSEVRPSAKTIAARMGKSVRSVRRLLHSLQSKKLIGLTYRDGDTNLYNLEPLIRKLEGVTKLSTPPVSSVQGAYTDLSNLPSPELSTKEEALKDVSKEAGSADKWKEVIELNLKHGSKAGGRLETLDDLENYKKTGEWPSASSEHPDAGAVEQ